jgi:hypothetical protein
LPKRRRSVVENGTSMGIIISVKGPSQSKKSEHLSVKVVEAIGGKRRWLLICVHVDRVAEKGLRVSTQLQVLCPYNVEGWIVEHADSGNRRCVVSRSDLDQHGKSKSLISLQKYIASARCRASNLTSTMAHCSQAGLEDIPVEVGNHTLLQMTCKI